MIQTVPLHEVFPPTNVDHATLRIAFTDYKGVHLDIEGALLFEEAVAFDGTVVLDRIVSLREAYGLVHVDQALPAGDYTLVAYYRPCDGKCGYLDAAQNLCSVEAHLEAGLRYELTVSVRTLTCSLATVRPATARATAREMGRAGVVSALPIAAVVAARAPRAVNVAPACGSGVRSGRHQFEQPSASRPM